MELPSLPTKKDWVIAPIKANLKTHLLKLYYP